MRAEKLSVTKVFFYYVCNSSAAFNLHALHHIYFDPERTGAVLRTDLWGSRCRVHDCLPCLCAPETDDVFGRPVQAA